MKAICKAVINIFLAFKKNSKENIIIKERIILTTLFPDQGIHGKNYQTSSLNCARYCFNNNYTTYFTVITF
jgi:hypothetical protein